MKKGLLLILLVLICSIFIGRTNEKEVYAVSDGIYDLVEEFYNEGVYTKKSNIYLKEDVLEDLARENIKVFHGKLDLERTTYYLKDSNKKDLLFMGNLDGTYASLDGNIPLDGINSGYRTVTRDDGSTYMDHFVYDGKEALETYRTNITSVEDYYVTLFDFLNEGQYNEWILNGDSYERELSDSYDNEFKNFLAFTAPCLEHVFFTDDTQYYFTVWDLKLSISKEVGYYGEYLSLKLIADITGESEGYVFNEDGIVSEARVYKDINVFDESDIVIDTTISDILAGKYEKGTKVSFVGEISGIYQAWNEEYKNISVYVQDTKGKQIVVYRTPNKLDVDEIVKVTGVVDYYGGSYQIALGSAVEVITETVDENIKHQFEMLALVVATSGTTDFTVPVIGKYGTPIMWSCDVEDVLTISADGNVILNREEDIDVELIANLGEYEKVFPFTIFKDSGGVVVVEKQSILSFADKANRITFTTTKQVWMQNGIVLTNDKGSSSNNVADYANPARFYAGSKITIECAQMKEIVLNCDSAAYATDLKTSIGTVSGATVTVSGMVVTVKFTTTVDSFVIAKLSKQVRVRSITVTHMVTE